MHILYEMQYNWMNELLLSKSLYALLTYLSIFNRKFLVFLKLKLLE